MNIIVAVDKFKGSLTCFEACKVIKSALSKNKLKYNVTAFPMADGGDGFSRVLKYYLKTKTISVNTVDPLHRKMKGYYEWDQKNKTAIVELAVASGIVLLRKKELNPLQTSTYGTGLLIQHAIKKGAKKLILGLGGSATNDGGMGIACALGFEFEDANGQLLKPCGASLVQIQCIRRPKAYKGIEIVIACDVNNPLYGKKGAAYIYAPQKGADKKQVEALDKGLKNLAQVIYQATNKKVSKIPGAGAAGGVAALLCGYFNATMMKGIDLMIQHSHVNKALKKADLLITGEGKIDEQSMFGKVVGTLVDLANSNKVPILLVAGINEIPHRSKLNRYPVIQLLNSKIGLKKSMNNAAEILHERMIHYFK